MLVLIRCGYRRKCCETTASVQVTVLDELTIDPSVINVLCNGESNGIIALTVSGGLSPYSYAWGTGETSSSITNLPSGTYDVTVTDSNDCVATASIQVTEPDLLTANATGELLLVMEIQMEIYT